MPAGQSLHPRDLTGGGADLRLKIGHDLALVQRGFQLLAQLAAIGAAGLQLFRIGANRPRPVLQGILHREFSGFQQGATALILQARGKAEADGARQMQPRPLMHDGFGHRRLQARGQMQKRV